MLNSIRSIFTNSGRNYFKSIIEKIATENGRAVGSPGHRKAREFILEFFEQSGIEPFSTTFELPFEVENEGFTNLVGLVKGKDSSLPAILVGAHYDTCGNQPGADDNGAAVSILMWLVSRLKQTELLHDVIIAFFDSEEPPYFLGPKMGSKYFHRYQLNRDIHSVLVWDLVGHDVPTRGLEDILFVIGSESHPKWPEMVSKTVLPRGLRMMPSRNKYIGDKSDYHSFREDGLPYLFLTCGRWEHYHERSDTPDKLNYNKIERVAKYSLELIIGMNAVDFQTKPLKSLDEFEIEHTMDIVKSLPGYEALRIHSAKELERFTHQFLKQHQL